MRAWNRFSTTFSVCYDFKYSNDGKPFTFLQCCAELSSFYSIVFWVSLYFHFLQMKKFFRWLNPKRRFQNVSCQFWTFHRCIEERFFSCWERVIWLEHMSMYIVHCTRATILHKCRPSAPRILWDWWESTIWEKCANAGSLKARNSIFRNETLMENYDLGKQFWEII